MLGTSFGWLSVPDAIPRGALSGNFCSLVTKRRRCDTFAVLSTGSIAGSGARLASMARRLQPMRVKAAPQPHIGCGTVVMFASLRQRPGLRGVARSGRCQQLVTQQGAVHTDHLGRVAAHGDGAGTRIIFEPLIVVAGAGPDDELRAVAIGPAIVEAVMRITHAADHAGLVVIAPGLVGAAVATPLDHGGAVRHGAAVDVHAQQQAAVDEA